MYYVTINQPEKRNKKVKVRIYDDLVAVSEVPVGLERYLDNVVPAFLSIQPADFPNSHAGRLALAGDEGRLVSELCFDCFFFAGLLEGPFITIDRAPIIKHGSSAFNF